MNGDSTITCPWSERVSSMIDGELDGAQIPLVRAHSETCVVCSRLMPGAVESVGPDSITDRLAPLPFQHSRAFRIASVVVGLVIVVGSIPGFVRGNTSGDALHDLRHLSIWQVAIGVAVASAGITSRFSRLILVMAGTFLALTAVATVYDLVTGHRGPWTDPTHVVEVIAALLLARFALPLTRTKARVMRHSPSQ